MKKYSDIREQISGDYGSITERKKIFAAVPGVSRNRREAEPAAVQEERLKKYLGVTGNKEKYCFGKGFMMVGKVKGTGGRLENSASSSTTT